MPGISGIEGARSLSELSPRTQVVFVTAYDQYAIDAFEQGAMDYLLKPVSDERLLATRERILSRLPSTRQDDAVLERLLQRLGPPQGAAERPPPARAPRPHPLQSKIASFSRPPGTRAAPPRGAPAAPRHWPGSPPATAAR